MKNIPHKEILTYLINCFCKSKSDDFVNEVAKSLLNDSIIWVKMTKIINIKNMQKPPCNLINVI